jgi:hypothetical protein
MDTHGDDISRLVERWRRGDESAMAPLIELAYGDLRQIAHRHLRSSPGKRTLGTTALVHELYLRLAGVTEVEWGGRGSFSHSARARCATS